jgi:hypothetical protein
VGEVSELINRSLREWTLGVSMSGEVNDTIEYTGSGLTMDSPEAFVQGVLEE